VDFQLSTLNLQRPSFQQFVGLKESLQLSNAQRSTLNAQFFGSSSHLKGELAEIRNCRLGEAAFSINCFPVRQAAAAFGLNVQR